MLGGSALEDHVIVGMLRILIREHGLHHDRPVAGEQRALAKARCRSGTSFAGGERQRSFADGFGRKEQRLADVISLEVGVQREDTLCGLTFSHEGNDSRNGNPKTAKTRTPPHLAGIGRDPLELHLDSSRRQLICERPLRQPCSSSHDARPRSAYQAVSDVIHCHVVRI
jgi:hypothetical protein